MSGGRFEHLEFENEPRARQEPLQSGAPIATAEGFLRKAHEQYRMGEFEAALRLYTRCLEFDRGIIPSWVGQVHMLVQLDELREARMWADKALELFRNNGELLASKAQACLRLEDKRAALACTDASFQAPGTSPYRWQVRGEIMLAHGEKAYDACFKRALTEPTSDWFDRIIIARIFLYYRRTMSALEMAMQAVRLQPEAAYAWYVQGNCQQLIGMSSVAMVSYGRCLEIQPGYRPAEAAQQQLSNESLFRRAISFFFGRRNTP